MQIFSVKPCLTSSADLYKTSLFSSKMSVGSLGKRNLSEIVDDSQPQSIVLTRLAKSPVHKKAEAFSYSSLDSEKTNPYMAPNDGKNDKEPTFEPTFGMNIEMLYISKEDDAEQVVFGDCVTFMKKVIFYDCNKLSIARRVADPNSFPRPREPDMKKGSGIYAFSVYEYEGKEVDVGVVNPSVSSSALEIKKAGLWSEGIDVEFCIPKLTNAISIANEQNNGTQKVLTKQEFQKEATTQKYRLGPHNSLRIHLPTLGCVHEDIRMPFVIRVTAEIVK